MDDGHPEPIALPSEGRVFRQERRPGLAECSPTGRLRLDALADWLQDIAYADVDDAGLAESAWWVVRRTAMRVRRFPRFGERFRASTFCSGIGRMWAERQTVLQRDGAIDPDVEAVSVWVHVDRHTRQPAPLGDGELAAYLASAGNRRVSAALRHPPPGMVEEISAQRPWRFRATELDVAGHVNNAAYWEPLEEQLLSGPEPLRIDAEIEYRVPAQPGPVTILHGGDRIWIVDDYGEAYASLRFSHLALAETGPP